MQLEDTLAYLTGTWTVSRLIADHRSGATGAFDGGAAVRSRGRGARYEETGRLRLAGYDGRARRVLDLIRTDRGRVSVLFADGRPFFDLDLSAGACRAVHQCSQDRYELEFRGRSEDLLLERWRVRGPRKDYEALTTWRRQ